MTRATVQSNYRVIVEPRRLGSFGSISVPDSFVCTGEENRSRQYRERCESIVQDVKRHVDEVGNVYLESDESQVCSHCGAEWTEPGQDYNGGCCAADQAAQDARDSAQGVPA